MSQENQEIQTEIPRPVKSVEEQTEAVRRANIRMRRVESQRRIENMGDVQQIKLLRPTDWEKYTRVETCVFGAPSTDESYSNYAIYHKDLPIGQLCRIFFQDKAVSKDEVERNDSINGCDTEDIIAILIHRLETFQKESCACQENDDALDGLYKALNALCARTKRRIEAGIEGDQVE